MGAIATQVRGLMEQRGGEVGRWRALGGLFRRNQQLLAEIGVSSEPLEGLIQAAQAAGSFGAKLSGGGRGGNIIALVDPAHPQPVMDALTAAGAKRVILTTVGERE